MSESNVSTSAIKTKNRTDLVVEVSQLIDEIRFRARKSFSQT